MFHFVTLDYFRNKNLSIEESDATSEIDHQQGEYVIGGVYSPVSAPVLNSNDSAPILKKSDTKHD